METDNHQNAHTFLLPYCEQYSPAKVTFTLHPEASLHDAIDTFKMFLVSVGYVFPENTSLGLVDEEEDYIKIHNDKENY